MKCIGLICNSGLKESGTHAEEIASYLKERGLPTALASSTRIAVVRQQIEDEIGLDTEGAPLISAHLSRKAKMNSITSNMSKVISRFLSLFI